jgi:hypothetical protein
MFMDQFHVLYSRISTLIYTGPIIYWIIATELLVRSNTTHVKNGDETEWSYGQVMALLTAIITTFFYSIQIWEDKERLDRMKELDQNTEGIRSNETLVVPGVRGQNKGERDEV